MDLLSLGYSPCPNNTYIFNALVHRLIPYAGPELAPPVLDDVETLNAWAMQGRFDITKLSCHAYGYLRDQVLLHMLRHPQPIVVCHLNATS